MGPWVRLLRTWYNSRFQTIFFSDLFFRQWADELKNVDFAGKAIGGSLWIERVAK
jgi:hypothetical protein